MNGMIAPNIFVDIDGTPYMTYLACLRKLTPDGLDFDGPIIKWFEGNLLENPSFIKKDNYYYWFESKNGTSVMGNTPNTGKVSVWRASQITGPYEKSPYPVITSNNRFQCVNTASVVLGPDNRFGISYNAIDMLRFTMCRQMMLDMLDWDSDGWPGVNNGKGPSQTTRKPAKKGASLWIPDLNDEFNSYQLEGISAGVLSKKWLFRKEIPGSWDLTAKPGWLRMSLLWPSVHDYNIANCIGQRPVGSYYTITTRMLTDQTSFYQQAGLIVREFTSTNSVAIGVNENAITVWFNYSSG